MIDAIRLLSSVEVDRDGATTTVRGDLPRALLARLAAAPGETLTADQLIDAVWPERGDSALSTLRAHLSRLRSGAVGGSLVGSRNGYRLEVARADVDYCRLLDGAATLDNTDAPEDRLAVAQALAGELARELVPGAAGPFLTEARRRLAETRRRVEERLGDVALELGDPSLASAVLEGTLARNPGHERPALLLATALARQSRTADAVAVLDAAGRGGMGGAGGSVAGSDRITALRTSIVRHEPAVVAPTASTAHTVTRIGLQIPLTRYVGRADVLAELRLARADSRLVTIVGPAGVGKTRTAVELAREATTALDDEQYLVDLAEVREPSDVIAAIARSVRASDATPAAIARRLADRRVLLILDNADHVLGALAIAASDLLHRLAGLRLLVTSREPLRLPEEREVVLRPFSADEDDAWLLLTERTADARGGLAFDEDEEEAARQLCAELDGIPLALELAASRLDVLDARAVRDGLGAASAGGRHDSLGAAISWTYDLLGPHLQRTLVHAGRFAGPFTVEAFAGIEGVSVDEADAALRDLVGKSLLVPERTETGRPRLRMLESMREFVGQRDVADEVTEWTARHRRWFAERVWHLAPTLRGFEARDTMALLDGARADIDAALDSSVVARDRTSAVLLVAGLAPYWHLRGRFREGRERVDAALAVPDDNPDVDAAHPHPDLPRAIAAAELELANLAYQVGDPEAGFVAIAAAQQHGQEAGDPGTVCVALARAAYGHAIFGDADTADQLITAARAVSRDAPEWAVCEVLLSRGQMMRARGLLGEAESTLREADERASGIGYIWMVTSARYVLAKTLIDSRRPRSAVGVARGAIDWAAAHEDAPAGLALMHAAAGACALTERHAIGARIFGAVDALGVRYGYNTLQTEGDEAERLRRAVASGLTVPEFDSEYAAGAHLTWADVVTLINTLPRKDAASTSRTTTTRAGATGRR